MTGPRTGPRLARLELAGILFPPDAKPGCDSRFWYDELRFLPIVEISPNLLSGISILAAYVIFGGSYLVFALGKFPGLKIDRPAAAIIGAVAMVAFRIVPAQGTLRVIDFPTIVLLF